ncbi:hypothetical protein ACLB2K_066400 [Fragaria x ananassa]
MNTRGLRDDIDMKKKVKEIRIGALGSNLTENFKIDQGRQQTCSRRATGKRKLNIKVYCPSDKKKRRHRRLKVEKSETSTFYLVCGRPLLNTSVIYIYIRVFSAADVRTGFPSGFRRFSTIPVPVTPFLLPGMISNLPQLCWNEEEGQRDRDRRSTKIGREVLSEIAADL